jgi:hypothetical protein
MKAWVNDLNTTNARIVVSIVLAVFVVLILTIGVTLLGWQPTAMQLKVLIGVGAGILTMQGFDVLQFWGKRFSDAGYVAAKNSALPPPAQPVPQVNGDTPSAPSSLAKPPTPATDTHLATTLDMAAPLMPGVGRDD